MTEDEKRRQLVKDYKNTFGTPEGQKVLDDLKKCSTFRRRSFCADNPHLTDFNEGTRYVVQYIQDKIDEKLDEEKPTEAIF